jgi:hypothetical protein
MKLLRSMFCPFGGVEPDSQRCELHQGLVLRFHLGQLLDAETVSRQIVVADDLLCCLRGPCFGVSGSNSLVGVVRALPPSVRV